MLPFLIPILTTLAENGLGILASAITAKGKDVVEKTLGVTIPDDASKLTPELIAQLKQKEMEHEEALLQMGIEKQKVDIQEEAMYLEDTKSARTMQETALKQDDIFSKRFIYYFASVIFIVTSIYIGCITFLVIPEANQRYADTILGFLLGTLISTIINFFFGTSKGSQHKDDTIKDLIGKVNNVSSNN